MARIYYRSMSADRVIPATAREGKYVPTVKVVSPRGAIGNESVAYPCLGAVVICRFSGGHVHFGGLFLPVPKCSQL